MAGLTKLLALLTVLTLVAAACGSDDGSSNADSAEGAGSSESDSSEDSSGGSELVVATASLPGTFAYDGGTGQGYVNEELTRNTQLALLRNPIVDDGSGQPSQDTFEFEGMLADSYEVSDDGLVYTFHLREGVLSAEGNELTVDDVLWSFERKWNTDTSPVPGQMVPFLTDPTTQLEKIDDYTMTATLDEAGYGFVFLSLMANYPGHVFDSDLLQEMATPEDPYAVAWSMENGNYGFGAYTIDSFTPGQEMVLAANPNWDFSDLDVERVTYRVVEDPGTRANALRSDDVDIAIQLRASDRADLAEAEGVNTYEFGYSNFLSLIGLVTDKPPFDDVLVRQAFAYAIPYDEILDTTYYGDASLRPGLMNPSWPNLDQSGYPDYTYDPEMALDLLEQAGYPDGGVEFTLTVENSVPDIQDMAVLIQSYAADAGFDVTVEELPGAAFTDKRNSREGQAWSRRGYTIVQAPYSLLRLFFNPETGQTAWNNTAYYEALDEGLTYADAQSPEASAAWSEAERIRLEDMPLVVVGSIQPLNAFSEEVEGYTWLSDNTIDFSLLTVG